MAIAMPLNTPRQNRIVHASSETRRVKYPAVDHATADSATRVQPRYLCRSTPSMTGNLPERSPADDCPCGCQVLSVAPSSHEGVKKARREAPGLSFSTE